MIYLKTDDEIEIMNDANKIVHSILNFAEENLQIGMTPVELDQLMEEELDKVDGGTSAFKGYGNYPNVSCISTNTEVVHGIPRNIPFKNGDVVSVDFGVYYKGFAGDAAKTFILGDPNKVKDLFLVKYTKAGLFAGIEKMYPGNKLHDIGKAISAVAKKHEFGNVKGFSGHGIGIKMHESPSVFNYVEPREPNVRLREGMVLALEPMFTLGSGKTKILEDDWTVITADDVIAAHWELSVAITKTGPRILGTNEYD